MLKLANIRIGVKLALMSGLGVLLVTFMIAAQMMGDAAVEGSIDTVIRQAGLTQNALDAKGSLRGLQVAVRDIRLALSASDFSKALKYLSDRETSARQYINEAGRLSRKAETNEKLKKIDASITQYVAGAKDIAAIKTEILALQSKRQENGALTAETIDRISSLDEQADRTARERTLPLAEQMEDQTAIAETGLPRK
jgi:hypothetical protein